MSTQLCACGCGRSFPVVESRGRRRQFYSDTCRQRAHRAGKLVPSTGSVPTQNQARLSKVTSRPPIKYGPDHPRYRPLEQRFWSKVEKTPSCWLWTATKLTSGFPYGMIGTDGTNKLAHRVSYELAYGGIPEGMNVLHHCDNPSCVRPDHLFLGTQKENAHDMARKGRRRGGFDTINQDGERNRQAKVTTDMVRAIRRRYAQGDVYQAQLALEYGVSVTTVSQIISRKRWRHIA